MITHEMAREALRLRYPTEYNDEWVVIIGSGDAFEFRRVDAGGWETPTEKFGPLGDADLSVQTDKALFKNIPENGVIIDKALYDLVVNYFHGDIPPTPEITDAIREGFPKPIDPDLLAAREWCEHNARSVTSAATYLAGNYDSDIEVRAFLAGVAHAR